MADRAPGAYERLVDRLLASPQFGVRWARHWLDIGGYAESDGGANADTKRPHAWRYRDYVVRAFNSNKPIDVFIREQLAGDELLAGEIDPDDSRQLELLTATGFLRLAPDATQTSNTLADRDAAVAGAMQVVSSAMLGLTVGCAQCHDHKYDPIGIDDYYRFRAIFDPAFPLDHWQQPEARLVDMTTEEVRQEVDRIEAVARQREADLNKRRDAVGAEILERKLADVPAAIREEVRAAVLTEGDKRSTRQQELLDQYPMVKPVRNIVGLLIEYDMAAYRKFEKELAEIAQLRETKPELRMVRATRERPDVVPESAVFFRGNPESRGETVLPAELNVLVRNGCQVELPENEAQRPTTGRRLAYARHLTSGRHPLTARVFVNRVWQFHMGRGIVSTPQRSGTGW